eukprot:771528-Amphidinium_carterae.1
MQLVAALQPVVECTWHRGCQVRTAMTHQIDPAMQSVGENELWNSRGLLNQPTFKAILPTGVPQHPTDAYWVPSLDIPGASLRGSPIFANFQHLGTKPRQTSGSCDSSICMYQTRLRV